MTRKQSPLYRTVYRALRGRILSGQYTPGAQIETEPELAAQFDASVITIRQAEGLLVDEGLLDKQQGRGTFVPAAVVQRQRLRCVCGLKLAQGLRHRLGSYIADLMVLSHQETARRNMEFEAVWLASHESARAAPYAVETAMRECWGFLFLACGTEHPLLLRSIELGVRHVSVSPFATSGNSVWLDFREAIRLAIGEFGDDETPTILALASLRQRVEDALRETGRTCHQEYFPEHLTDPYSYETLGYLHTDELLREGRDLTRFIVLDDVVARGATRALLAHGYGKRDLKLVVFAGEAEVVPLGLPATYVVHDTEEEVRQAFAILDRQQPGQGIVVPSWRSGSRLLRNVSAAGTVED